MLAKHAGIPIFAPRTVANHIRWSAAGVDGFLREIEIGVPVPVGEFSICAFPTSHDTDQSVGYRIDGSSSFALCTDTGCVTTEMLAALSGCEAALIEANHDVDMLRAGPYPYYLKRRILSERGHLSNDDSAALCCSLAEAGLRTLVLGHLSAENNTPELALDTALEAVTREGLTPEEDIFLDLGWRDRPGKLYQIG